MTPPLLNKPFFEIRNGHRYRKCEVCKEKKKERYFRKVKRSDGLHWICVRCNRSPARQEACLRKEHPELFASGKGSLKNEENKVLWNELKAKGLNDAEIRARIANLKSTAWANHKKAKLTKKAQSKPTFKDEFGKLTERRK